MKIQKLFANTIKIIILLFLLQSCTTVTEEIYLEQNGSGTYVFYTDMIPFMKNMAFQMDKMFKKDDSTAVQETDEERMARIEEEIWEDFPDYIDSTYSMSDELPDSVRQNKDIMKYFDKAEGFMEGGKSKGYVYMGFRYTFSELQELQEFMKVMKEIDREDGQQKEMLSGLNNSIERIDYSFDGEVFSKKVDFVEKQSEKDKNSQMFEAMIGSTIHTEIIHLPREVERVEGRTAKSIESKTVTFENELDAWLSGKFKGEYKIYMK